jgi:hypothetical protein
MVIIINVLLKKIRTMSKEKKELLMHLAGEMVILIGEWLKTKKLPCGTSSNAGSEK